MNKAFFTASLKKRFTLESEIMDTPLTPYLPYLEWIATQKERMIALVAKWSRISSHSYDVEGLAQMADALSTEVAPLAHTIETFTLEPQCDFDEEGRTLTRPLGKAISFKKSLPNTPSVLLNGHLDTVHHKSLDFPTTRLSPSILQGPGVADMKGGLVVALIALEALERSPFAGRLSWELFCNPDEEVGSTGSYPYLELCAKRHACAFVFEPTLPDGRFVSSRMGAAGYCVLAKGRSAHVGRDFKQGVSAISLLLPVIEQLNTWCKPDEGIILSVGVIRGGTSATTVPQHALIRFTLRVQTDEQLARQRSMIQDYVGSLKNVSLLEVSHRAAKPLDAKQERFFNAIAHAGRLLSIPVEGAHTGGVCDGNIFAAAGLPTLDTMGPIGGKLHTPQEYLDLDSLVPKATLTALSLMQIASKEFGGV